MKVFFACILSVITFTVEAQKQEGLINFKQTTHFEGENLPPDAPKSMEQWFLLQFTKEETIYQFDKSKVVEDVNENRFFRRMKERSDRILYKNLTNNSAQEQLSLFNKEFLVSDSIAEFKWKISAGEQKSIAGFTCMKAILKDSTQNVIAFFTPQIPVSSGPDKYGKLPGLILEIQSEFVHIIATEVKVDTSLNKIQIPTKGDKMTRKEFLVLREAKMKEQQEMWGGNRRNTRFRN